MAPNAVWAPLLIAMRNLPVRLLFALGATAMIVPPISAAVLQPTIGADGQGLGEYWGIAGTMSYTVGPGKLRDIPHWTPWRRAAQ